MGYRDGLWGYRDGLMLVTHTASAQTGPSWPTKVPLHLNPSREPSANAGLCKRPIPAVPIGQIALLHLTWAAIHSVLLVYFWPWSHLTSRILSPAG
jgi:hypothetical protein